ncbi:uncharacterized protein MELLADRAFT_65043 [Melampsora larici-populina 98AG31]|uniref:Uncharacterized protein n=1 Tax=Melampsora larici-populina (strain 98AG31 / pathotype 3-4-7) TaxID=747676 RepID=F4RTS4_MELLP|nr:uncharacterized protein MELLADRAFT_65043 [Melampsora larici-populina 98AG31]EGG04209.1 hypothetical protein MELLADRAFT_65043 [Melampsora larici-populina 98AG31]
MLMNLWMFTKKPVSFQAVADCNIGTGGAHDHDVQLIHSSLFSTNPYNTFSDLDGLFPSEIVNNYPFIGGRGDSGQLNEQGDLLTKTSVGVYKYLSAQDEHGISKMERNEMKMYNEDDVWMSNFIKEFDSMNHLNFSPLPESTHEEFEEKTRSDSHDISNNLQKTLAPLKTLPPFYENSRACPPDSMIHRPRGTTDPGSSPNLVTSKSLGEQIKGSLPRDLPISALEINDHLVRNRDEISILKVIETQSPGPDHPETHPESQDSNKDVWEKEQGKRSKLLLRAQDSLNEDQQSIRENDLTTKKDYNLKSVVINRKRKNPHTSEASDVELGKHQNLDHSCYLNNDVDIFPSEESIISLPSSPSFPKQGLTTLGCRNGLEDTVISTDNKETKGKVLDILDDVPRRKRTHRQPNNRRKETENQAIVQTRKICEEVNPCEDTSIYKHQPRTSFDSLIEKHITPFMTQFEDFLQEDMYLEHRNPRSNTHLMRRLRFMTHEFLLLLVKSQLTYATNGEDLNQTLVEGYQWLTNIWKTIPIDALIMTNPPKSTRPINGYTALGTMEETLISRVMSTNLFSRSQQKLNAYVILTWMQRFRPNWLDVFKITPQSEFWKIPEYRSNLPLVQTFISGIEKRILEIESDMGI